MPDYEIHTFPRSRRATFDVGRIGGRKHHIAGLLEADVTLARERIRAGLKEGLDLGFIPWFLKVLSLTIAADRKIHAINHGSRRQIIFQDIDISIPLEREVEGKKVPLPVLIRRVNEKSIEEISLEIRSFREKAVESERDYVLSEQKNGLLTALFFRLPGLLRRLVWKRLLKNPFSVKENMGTVIVTNIGMTGRSPGWILPKSLHNLGVGIGTICKKPRVIGKEIVAREVLHLTVLFDHDAVDGSPAARFSDQLVRNLENALDL